MTDGLFELAASYAACNAPLVGTFFGAAIAMHGLYTSCAFINPNDLSPNYASTICAMMYVLGATASIFMPLIFARLAPNVWRNFPFVTLFANAVFYLIKFFVLFFMLVFFVVQSLILEWRQIFWIIMGSQLSKIVLFVLWGSAEIQEWNAPAYQVIR